MLNTQTVAHRPPRLSPVIAAPVAAGLPDAFIRWQLETRRATYDAIRAGRHPRRHTAHLPVMITFQDNGDFPVRVATKGAGFTPRDDALDRYIALLEGALARCEGRPWEETLPERVAAVQLLLDHPADIDPRRLGFLEIFAGGTYRNLQHDSRVALHYTGEGPDYPSFQINGHAEILDREDPRYRYIALTRRIFEGAPFHIPQTGYAAGYLVWVQETLDKTPRPLKHLPTATSRPHHFGLSVAEEKNPKPEIENRKSGEVTFRDILVPVDNSKYSAWAMDIALQIAGDFRSTVVGNHVYAARLHDRRFQDMEPGLPERYQEPTIIAHQRDLHDTLIGKGLKLISDSYLEALKQRCARLELDFVGKTPEGKNYAELVKDIEAGRYDLVVMGARGQGSRGVGRRRRQGTEEQKRRGDKENPRMTEDLRDDSPSSGRLVSIGSVCERVVRRISWDVLVVKDGRPLGGTFLVGIDGSEQSFAALRIALSLAESAGAQVHAVAVYDPFLHKVLFHELEGALTEEAQQVFNTEAQQKLHDELIDSGIAKIYGDHLETAQRIAAEDGHRLETRLLAGKADQMILRYARKIRPTLLALGRIGVHADDGLDIGSNAENLLRFASCHVLLAGRTFTPTWAETQKNVEEQMPWTPEALAHLEHVPDFARSMARKAIEDYAGEQGASFVDERLVNEARKNFGM